jgi:surfeit locus 1 family protein
MMLRGFFTPRWVITTILVVIGVAVLVRLGFWQLDRHEQRKAFNDRVLAQTTRIPINLNQELPILELYNMEYRQAIVTGVYDAAEEILLRNQVRVLPDGSESPEGPGYHLLTPLLIEGQPKAILVNRGWIPLADGEPAKRAKYIQPGKITLRGVIRRPQSRPDFGGVPDPTLQPGQTRLDAWNIVNLERIQQQTRLDLLPVYLQLIPQSNQETLPQAVEPNVEISEGNHLSYAGQWFTFAALLGLGYPFFVRSQLKKNHIANA